MTADLHTYLYAHGDPNECPCCQSDGHTCDLCDDLAHTGTPQYHDTWLTEPEDEYDETRDPRWLAHIVDTALL